MLQCSDMVHDSKGIIQFYLPPTHEPYLPLLPSCKASPLFGWCSLRLFTEGWPGWVDLGGWLYTEIDFLALRVEPPDMATHPSTNCARRRATSLIETSTLPLSQTANHHLQRDNVIPSVLVSFCCLCISLSGCLVSEMAYYVSSGTLNPTHSLSYSVWLVAWHR